ncbi:DNA-binding protein [Paenibacillus sp. FA6]|uniref:DNA-binding protein n=1 Tax=Paenibacillus sp. FA6 TaxID=3413029 RepID=UPI003F6560A5
MSPATTIRAEITNYLECNGHTFSSFGQTSGINKGVISAILNNNSPKPISVRQIDLITKGLGYAEGALYDLYVEECFFNEKPNGRRISAFLIRCAELGKEDCIAEVLSRLMENLIYVALIFSIAEKLYMSEMMKESIIFYQCVAEHEKYQHSERLAISQYRIFRASLGLDSEHNMEATLQFVSYRKRLPENYHLDALNQLMNIYYTMDKYEKVEQYADELIILSNIVLENEKNRMLGKRAFEPLATEKPLFVYYAYGYLMKGAALEHQGHYKEAMKYVAVYADLSWIEGLDQEGLFIVEQYRLWAIANTYTLEILMGNVNILPEYTQLLQDNPKEILAGLLTIMESANRHSFSVDDILEQFNDAIQEYQKDPFSNLSNGYTDGINRVSCANLCYQIALYQFSNKRYSEGMRNTLQSLTINAKINKKGEIIDSMSLFERYRSFASKEELGEYDQIIKGGYNHEENSSFVNFGD